VAASRCSSFVRKLLTWAGPSQYPNRAVPESSSYRISVMLDQQIFNAVFVEICAQELN